MTTLLEKDKAHKLIDKMPANATWDTSCMKYMFERSLSEDWRIVKQAEQRT